jgi:hypothetical protein
VKIKFKSIELFGVSGSGKTFLRNKIKKKLIVKGYKIFDVREIIILYIGQVVKLNFYEKILIFYFSFLLKFNIKTTLWNKTLSKVCDKYLNKEQKKYLFFKKKMDKIFLKNTEMQFNFHYIWIKELIIANMIFEKLKKFDNKIIFFPDEGFVQKIFLLNYTKQNKNKTSIKTYFNNKIFCDLIINIKSLKSTIVKVNEIKNRNKNGWILKKDEINKMIKLEKKIKNTKYFKFEVLKNYKKIEDQINNLIYR